MIYIYIYYSLYVYVKEGKLKEIDWSARDSLEQVALEIDFERWDFKEDLEK